MLVSLARRRTALARRALSTSLPPHKLMPMPRLSPSMRTGKLEQWLVVEGDEVRLATC